MQATDRLDQGRAAYDAHDWAAAYEALSDAAQDGLSAEDRLRLAATSYLVGEYAEADRAFDAAFLAASAAGDLPTAVRAGFWAGFVLANRGDAARSRGWVERMRRLATGADRGADGGADGGAERLAVDVLDALLEVRDGRLDLAGEFAALAGRAAALGERDLEVLALMGEGFSLAVDGHPRDGIRRLDEVMVTTSGLHPLATGLVLCVGLDVCHFTLDLRRSALWTAELTRWCRAQPGLVPYRGQCLVHRVQVLTMRGAWGEALEEARRACDLLREPPDPAVGAAAYEWAELHRLRGEHEVAEEKYAEAARWGHDPQPGWALLRLAQGRLDAAEAGLRRSLAEPLDSTVVPAVLAACVDVLVEGGRPDEAARHVHELRETAAQFDMPLVGALAAHAAARLALARGDAVSALRDGRRAWSLWHELEAPYHAARSRVVVGEACRSLGDEDAARMELAAAEAVFGELGARDDLRRMHRPDGTLSAREREVLRLVAQGLTNKAIAAELFLSQKTVARHVSNIFAKTGVTTRTAAAAHAFRHGLV